MYGKNLEEQLNLLKHRIHNGDAKLVASIVKDNYKYHTVLSQIRGDRTIKPKVLNALRRVIENRERLTSTLK